MTLREEIKTLSGNRRRFFLLRVADLDTKAALKLCGVVRGTYNSWLLNEDFVELYRRRDELAGDFRQEAIQLLRRDNQLDAVLLEATILRKMKADLEEDTLPEGSIVRTNLAREVYSKLMTELDAQPYTQILTWQERIALIVANAPEQITEGEIVNGETSEPETDSVEETEH